MSTEGPCDTREQGSTVGHSQFDGDCDLEVGEGAKNEMGTRVWYVVTPTYPARS